MCEENKSRIEEMASEIIKILDKKPKNYLEKYHREQLKKFHEETLKKYEKIEQNYKREFANTPESYIPTWRDELI